jgi:hypothetical protein
MQDSGIFKSRLVNFPAIWYILRHYGVICGHLVNFPRFGILCHEKSGIPVQEDDLDAGKNSQPGKKDRERGNAEAGVTSFGQRNFVRKKLSSTNIYLNSKYLFYEHSLYVETFALKIVSLCTNICSLSCIHKQH